MRRLWLTAGAIGLILLAGLGILAEGGGGAFAYRLLQSYVEWRMQARLRAAARLAVEPLPGTMAQGEDYLVLVYDQKGALRAWNSHQWPLFAPTLTSLSPEIYADEEKAYYLLKQRVESLTVVVAIPLWVTYPVPYQHTYFLGQEAFGSAGLRASPAPRRESLPLLYRDLSGQTVFRLYVGPWEAWLHPFRVLFLAIGAVWVAGLLVWLHRRWRPLSHGAYLGRMGLVVGLLWMLLKIADLPGRYLEGAFFHAESLAWGWLLRSAWDFLVLGGIIAWALYSIPRQTFRRAWFLVGGYWVFWGVMGLIFWGLARHSQLSLEISDFAHFGDVFLILGIVLAVSGQFLAGKVEISERRLWLWIGTFSLLGSIITWVAGVPWWGVVSLAVLYLSFFMPLRVPGFVWGLFQGVLLSIVVNSFFSAAQEWRAEQRIPAYAKLAAFPRDLLLEARLSYRLARLSQDTLLWQNLSTADNLIDATFIARLTRKYFLSLSENYLIALSFWSEQDTRLDNQYELLPISWRSLPPDALTPTLSPHLFFVVKGTKRYFYAGRYPLSYQGYPIFLQIELYPRVRPLAESFAGTAPSISYALYDNQQRVFTHGHSNFPSHLYRSLESQWSWQHLPDKYQVYYRASAQQHLILEYQRRTILHVLASFPFILLILGLIKALELVCKRPEGWKIFWETRHRLAPRVRAVFFATVILPLIGLLGVSFLFFIRLTQGSLEDSLRRKLTILHSYIQDERILSEKLLTGINSYIPHEESYIRDLMQRLARLTESQVAIYTADGFLYSSTLSPAYVGIYVFPLLDPSVKTTAEEFMVARREWPGIGRVTYGYMPLRNSSGRLLGYIQVTFPAPQVTLYQAIRGFIAYGVNVYLLLILVSTLVGLSLMEHILRGLSEIEDQVRKAPIGTIPPRLSWPNSQDEIGTFVRAYNEMINRLEISQRELEMTLRQISQQEMARQAAHEIKNALTPIKLIAQYLQRLPHIEPEKLHRLSHEMLQKIETLARIANRFLTFAGPQDPSTLTLVPIHLNHFLEEYFQPYLQNTSIHMKLLLSETPVWIKGHPDLLSQVLNNLVQNALQALEGRENSEITLSLETRDGEAWIAMRDNGPGIPPDVQARMFEFYFTTKRSGTGLGLAISKRLVEQMQGRIFAETQLGQGTVFYVVFPAYMP
jgi:signal transduction histidine kinase